MDCTNLIKKYISLLDSNFTVKKTDYGCAVYTPFMGLDCDPISFYIEYSDENSPIILTDGGKTLAKLKVYNIGISGKLSEYFDQIKKIYRIHESGEEIYISTTIDDIGKDLNSFIIALQSISHFEYFRTSSKEKVFNQVVHEFLDYENIPHNYMHLLNIKAPHTIDIMSIDEKVLVQAFGSTTGNLTLITRQVNLKLVPYMEIHIENLEQKKKMDYYRMVILDTEFSWPDSLIQQTEKFADEIIGWRNKEKLIPLLQQHSIF
jgi:hypothetical protein